MYMVWFMYNLFIKQFDLLHLRVLLIDETRSGSQSGHVATLIGTRQTHGYYYKVV